MFVHVRQQEADIRGKQVIHLVAQGRFAEQLVAPHQVANGHVEVRVAAAPVGDAGKWVGD